MSVPQSISLPCCPHMHLIDLPVLLVTFGTQIQSMLGNHDHGEEEDPLQQMMKDQFGNYVVSALACGLELLANVFHGHAVVRGPELRQLLMQLVHVIK